MSKKIIQRRTYRRRCIRNLVLSALLLLLIWTAAGYPLPASLAMGRLEDRYLLEHARRVLEIDGTMGGDSDMVVGVTDRHVHTFRLDRESLTVWERRGTEPTLVPLPDRTRYQQKGGSYLAPALVAVDAPEGAASARVTMELTYLGEINGVDIDWSDTYVVEGEQMGVCWFFQLTYKNEYDRETEAFLAEDSWLGFTSPFLLSSRSRPPYTLEFFDAGGESLGTFTGTMDLVPA